MSSRSKTNHSAENLLLHRLESGYCLPPLSPVAAKLIDLASEDTCSVHKLAQLIEQDPSLTVSLLKLLKMTGQGNEHLSSKVQSVTGGGFPECT